MDRLRRRAVQVALWKLADRLLLALELVGGVGLVAALFLPGLAGGVMLLFRTWGTVVDPDTFLAISLGLGGVVAAASILFRFTVPPVREWFDRKWHVYRLIHQLP